MMKKSRRWEERRKRGTGATGCDGESAPAMYRLFTEVVRPHLVGADLCVRPECRSPPAIIQIHCVRGGQTHRSAPTVRLQCIIRDECVSCGVGRHIGLPLHVTGHL